MWRALFGWIPASLRAALDQVDSEPTEAGYKGHGVVHERPHLVPIGYILMSTPFMLVAHLVLPAPNAVWITFAGWVLFVIAGLTWSLALYLGQHRARTRKQHPQAGPHR